MTTFSAAPHETTVAVIGAGRLGTALARALRTARYDVRGPLGRDRPPPRSEIALLCVPDAAIIDAARQIRPHARLIGHVSGAAPLDGVDFSIHPLQTFTGVERPGMFRGIGAAVAGRTPDALRVAEALALALGAHPFTLDHAHRAGYHAAASFASNFVLTMLDTAEQLATDAGIPPDDARALLAPLARQTIDNWVATGAAALTGPIARGDTTTVARQRTAVAQAHPALAPLFDAVAARTRTVAEKGTA